MINIAIDGPSGAGKSTISRAIAKNLGYVYVDTGALYRAVGLFFHCCGVDKEDKYTISGHLDEMELDLKFENGEQKIYLNEVDVTNELRTPTISMYASAVSAIGSVRQHLFQVQLDIAAKNNCIMDGRDIGTVVLPEAQVKIFLTASLEERAKRRYDELILKGEKVTYDEVLADMKKRDEDDSSREIAPLKPAEDAIVIDTTGNTFEQSVELIQKTIEEKLKDAVL